MSSIRFVRLWGIIMFALTTLLLNIPALGHYTIGRDVDGYNVTLELIQLSVHTHEEDAGDHDHAEDTHSDDAHDDANFLTVGTIEVNIHLLDRQYAPIDTAAVQVALTFDGEEQTMLNLTSQGRGRYSASYAISETGMWDFSATASVPGGSEVLNATYSGIEVFPVSEAQQDNTLMIVLLIAVLAVLIAAAIFVMVIKPKDAKKGA